jgi:hypothetical protein
MKTKTYLKAGALSANHNETLGRATRPAAGLTVKTYVLQWRRRIGDGATRSCMMKMFVVLGLVLSVLSLTFGLGYAREPLTCAIQTVNGHFLTAVGGGGQTTDVIHTDATIIDAWEKFTLIDAGGGAYGLRTVNGHFLTAVGGGGRTTDVIHTDATQILAWEKFTPHALRDGYYAITTVNGHFLTAVGGGGQTTDVIHTDATQVQKWEVFRFICLVGVGE